MFIVFNYLIKEIWDFNSKENYEYDFVTQINLFWTKMYDKFVVIIFR